MVDDILYDQVNGHHFQRLVSSPELLNDVGVMAVKGAEEDHGKKKRRNDDLASHHLQNNNVKLGCKTTIGLSSPWSSLKIKRREEKVLATELGRQ
jgi:hypothetical protein